MNIIFISPNYPEDRWRYVNALRGLGVNVFGIGDAVEESFPHGLKGCLNDYYRVDDLSNYDAVYRAVAYLSYKYGRSDAIESLNDYWAPLEASLRRDYNVVGFDSDYVRHVFNKDYVKDAVRSVGIDTAEFDGNGSIIVPEGRIIKCCGLMNRYGKLSGLYVYEFSDLPQRIIDENGLLAFYSVEYDRDFAERVADAASSVGVKGGFFNFTFAEGDKLTLLDASFLPPEEYFADAISCSGASDICHAWAADKVGMNMDFHAASETTVYATRKFDRSYRYSHDRVLTKLRLGLRRYGRCYTGEKVTGDYFYIFRAEDEQKAKDMIRFIQMDYCDIGPVAQFPALKAVPKNQLRQTAIREQSSVDARILLNRKIHDKAMKGVEDRRKAAAVPFKSGYNK